MNATGLHITSNKARKQAIDILNDGGVVVIPTDTLYGLSTCLVNSAGVDRIAIIKGTPDEQSFLVLADSMAMIEPYVMDLAPGLHDLLYRIWPAPLTAIMRTSPTCPDWAGETIAFRVPALKPLRKLITDLGRPIVSTSVNRSGEPPLAGISQIQEAFGDEVDLVVAGDSPEDGPVASTIVDFTGEKPVLVRMGSYLWPDDARGDSNPSK